MQRLYLYISLHTLLVIDLMEPFVVSLAELLCYSGGFLSLVIAWRLFKMENLTFLNKMFLVYFSTDFVFATVETYFQFKLLRER